MKDLMNNAIEGMMLPPTPAHIRVNPSLVLTTMSEPEPGVISGGESYVPRLYLRTAILDIDTNKLVMPTNVESEFLFEFFPLKPNKTYRAHVSRYEPASKALLCSLEYDVVVGATTDEYDVTSASVHDENAKRLEQVLFTDNEQILGWLQFADIQAGTHFEVTDVFGVNNHG